MSLGPWIRVNAALLDDKDVRRFGIDLLPKIEPWAARAAGAGFLTALWGKMSTLQPDGSVAHRDDEQLEEWAQWKGKAGHFATLFRERFVDQHGVIVLWEEYQGAALARRAADKLRKASARASGQPADVPADTPPDSPRDVRVTSGRNENENENETNTNSGTAEATPDLSKGEPRPQKTVENPVHIADGYEISATVRRFMARFYGAATAKRREEVAREITAGILHNGVKLKGEIVQAVDVQHLDDMCQEVMEDPPRQTNAAWVIVLMKIQETRDATLRARALEAEPKGTREVSRETETGASDDGQGEDDLS